MERILLMLAVLLSSNAFCQDNSTLINDIDRKLAANQTTISKVLSNAAYMHLHSLTEFREIIKKHARPGKLLMVTDDEPGRKITVKGSVKRKNGEPVTDALVYLYQTSARGWYADTAPHVNQMEGDMRHARLFAYLKTDDKGEFELLTVQPKGYPRSDLPAHIHIMMWKEGKYLAGIPGELLFDDDERLTPERRRASIANGFLIEKNSGTESHPVYDYKIVVN